MPLIASRVVAAELAAGGVRSLPPAYFAVIMATGIVALAAEQEPSVRWAAQGLTWLNLAIFGLLSLLLVVRVVRYRCTFGAISSIRRKAPPESPTAERRRRTIPRRWESIRIECGTAPGFRCYNLGTALRYSQFIDWELLLLAPERELESVRQRLKPGLGLNQKCIVNSVGTKALTKGEKYAMFL
jgi:hypothetical protein